MTGKKNYAKNSTRNSVKKSSDVQFMHMAIELAKKGLGHVSPNPAVGCVIVKNGKIIGRGYHKKFGFPHAEIEALRQIKNKSARHATLYCSLEPCNHHGKTRPCTEAVIKAGVRKVFFGAKDSVHSGGARRLKKAGIQVEQLLKPECEEFLKWWLKYSAKRIPYVTLKAAISLDGKITCESGKRTQISSDKALAYSKSQRRFYDAILVGANTVRIDNPVLKSSKGKNPIKVVVSKDCNISPDAKIFESGKVILFCTKKPAALFPKNATVIQVRSKNGLNGLCDVKDVLAKLGKMGIAKVLVEGGSGLYNSFLRANCVDEIILYIAPKILSNGLPAFWHSFDGFRIIEANVIGNDAYVRLVKA